LLLGDILGRITPCISPQVPFDFDGKCFLKIGFFIELQACCNAACMSSPISVACAACRLMGQQGL
jgi:hypothetical protein